MRYKAKVLKSGTEAGLEEKVARFLADLDGVVRDTRFTMVVCEGRPWYSVFILVELFTSTKEGDK